MSLPESAKIFSADFFPCIDFFRQLPSSEIIHINTAEQYKKQSYHSRAYILGPHKVEMLQVPVKKYPNHALISTIWIDYSTSWNRKAWRTVVNCYRNSPYFEFFERDLEALFYTQYEHLVDLNVASLSLCLKLMQVKKTICLTNFSYYDNKNLFISFNAKRRLENAENVPFKPYFQNFGNKFESNLSVLDLLFMVGTASSDVLWDL